MALPYHAGIKINTPPLGMIFPANVIHGSKGGANRTKLVELCVKISSRPFIRHNGWRLHSPRCRERLLENSARVCVISSPI